MLNALTQKLSLIWKSPLPATNRGAVAVTERACQLESRHLWLMELDRHCFSVSVFETQTLVVSFGEHGNRHRVHLPSLFEGKFSCSFVVLSASDGCFELHPTYCQTDLSFPSVLFVIDSLDPRSPAAISVVAIPVRCTR